jgi:hypothetical protein
VRRDQTMNAKNIYEKYGTVLEQPFTILGYADSKGAVRDLPCHFVRYRDLERDSLLAMLLELEEGSLDWAKDSAGRARAFEMARALARKLHADPSPTASAKAQMAKLEPVDSNRCVCFVREDPQTLVLRNLMLDRVETEGPDPDDLAKSRDEDSRWKKIILASLPSRRFVPRLNLRHGKFVDIVPTPQA